MKKHMKFDLNMHTARLLMSEPFFASLSRRINKTASTSIPTAGVRVNPDTAQFEMLYNPEFFGKLDDAQRQDVLKHEFYHLVFEHLFTQSACLLYPKTMQQDLLIQHATKNMFVGRAC